MWLNRSIPGFIIAAFLFVGCQSVKQQNGSLPSPPTSSQLLYLVDDGRVTTYSIDPNTLNLAMIGGPVDLIDVSSSLLQLVPSPNDRFVYLLWSDAGQQEHLSAYATDSAGIPQAPPVQVLNVSSLSQLSVHPSGELAYAIHIESSAGMYTSTIFLFHVTASGTLQMDTHAQGVYGPAVVPTLLYGLSGDGTQLYIRSEEENGSAYWQRAVNPQDGTLGTDILLFSSPFMDSVALGRTVIVEYQNALTCSEPRYLKVFANNPEPSRQLIQCGSDMLQACGTATDVQIHPSGHYLFLTDPASQKIRIARMNMSNEVIADTGNFIPFTMQTPGFAFSPDGTLVYALLACDCSLHVYRFDQSSGYLVQGPASIPMTSSAGFLPATRP